MYYYNTYSLRKETADENERYYVTFKDGQGNVQDIEINSELYSAFLDLNRSEYRQNHFFERHVEHFEVTDSLLSKSDKSIEDCLSDKELSKALWFAIDKLPEKQRKRFILYFDMGYTYQQIADLENCSITAVKFSIDKAKANIIKDIQKYL